MQINCRDTLPSSLTCTKLETGEALLSLFRYEYNTNQSEGPSAAKHDLNKRKTIYTIYNPSGAKRTAIHMGDTLPAVLYIPSIVSI